MWRSDGTAAGTVKLQAKLTNNGSAVGGAAVTVKLDRQNAETVLFDDGKHDDEIEKAWRG